jgi:hypothetical protein
MRIVDLDTLGGQVSEATAINDRVRWSAPAGIGP